MLTIEEGFVNIDNDSMRRNHWTCVQMKDHKSSYF